MDIYEYLKKHSEVLLGSVAKRMYPTNKAAENYLSRKLTGARPFTLKDAELAKKALSELGQSFDKIDIGDGYPRK